MKKHISVIGRALPVGALFALLASSVFATDVPQNLGNGLDKLVASNLALKAQAKGGRTSAIAQFNGYATEEAANAAASAIADLATNRFLVDIHPNGRVPFQQLKDTLTSKFSSLTITATDTKYRGVGMIEGYISIDDVPALANTLGVTSVQLGIKPYHKKTAVPISPVQPQLGPVVSAALTLLGTTFDQGVTQHRVDQIDQIYNPAASFNYDGNGLQVGCLSDSFSTSGSGAGGATDQAAGNLPGSASPYNTTPVVNLQDEPGGTDEGRGMCQIVYKMAPRAKLAFATADTGELGFANNIRALAGLAGFTYPNQTFKADAVCDDVGYYDEPIFQDGIIADGIDDVAAAGVSYFSSASNDIGTNGYASTFNVVPNGTGLTAAAGNTALVGTNINLTGVPVGLYAGGFHNFNPNAGQQDVAQTWSLPSGAQTVAFQWDDPYDQNTAPVLDMPAIYHNTGSILTTTGTLVTYSDVPALTAGQLYEIQEHATSGSFDGQVYVYDPSNNLIVFQDNGIDETVNFYAPVTGVYTIKIGAYSTTTGTFTVDVYHAEGFTGTTITSNWSLLTFRIDTGAYIAASSLTANTFATNEPIQLGSVTRPSGQTGVQFVFARSNIPPASPQPASHFRLSDPGNGAGSIGPVEYFTYDSFMTGGHDSAAGCNGMAAYSVFRPSIPESYTSPGPVIIYFDKSNNRLATPTIRLQPTLAAADGANQTWTGGDSTSDGDSTGNFSGTSAAGPHAAAIAALVLQAHGGTGSVTPTQMTSILTRSTFLHDLDPCYVSGTAKAANGGKLTITVNSDSSTIAVPAGSNPAITTGGLGLQDVNSWNVAYVGPGFLTSLTFNPSGTAATAGSPTSGNNGVDATNTYFSNVYPGMVFMPATKAFTLGTLTGLVAADVTVPLSTTPYTGFSNLAPLPSNGTSQFWTMAIGFPNANFTGGKSIHFTVGRGQQHSSTVGTFASPTGGLPFAGPNSGTTASNPTADLLGGGVLIPEGTVTTTGMAFSGTVSDGVNSYPFSGTLNNRIGSGYSVQDGYGFINAQTAVSAPIQ
jgi:hypothetical protein